MGTQKTPECSLTRKGEQALWSIGYDALKCLWSTLDPLDPNEQVPKT
jgi:hypothetical protein